MTKDEKVYVENYIIAQLNDPCNRLLAAITGKQNTMCKRATELMESSFPELTAATKETIIENILQKAKSCAYPQEDLPFESRTLNYKEILFLGDVTVTNVKKTVLTLAEVTDVMHEYGDERWEKLKGALDVFEELLQANVGAEIINNRISG